MVIDWDFLGQVDIFFGVIGGVILAFSTIQWIGKRFKSSRFIKLLTWSLIGQEDEDAFRITIHLVIKYVLAGVVWGIIGGIIGSVLGVIFVLIKTANGNIIDESNLFLFQSILVGGITGIIIRLFLWPLIEWLNKKYHKSRVEEKLRQASFQQQKQRIETEIRKGKTDD